MTRTETKSLTTQNKINWQQLQPQLNLAINPVNDVVSDYAHPMDLQPRLMSAIHQFCQQRQGSPFMIINAEESYEHLSLIAETVQSCLPKLSSVVGYSYTISENIVSCSPALSKSDNFAAKDRCGFEEWINGEQLFGGLRQYQQQYTLFPGLVHHLNGGILLLSGRTLLRQPLLWQRLKQIITQKRFKWLSPDEKQPFALHIPDMSINLKLIIVTDYYGLAEFQEMEPELISSILYAEFEQELLIRDDNDFSIWIRHLKYYTDQFQLTGINENANQELLLQATRYTGDQWLLPLSPSWIKQLISTTSYYKQNENELSGDMFREAYNKKQWRENYLQTCSLNEILHKQINIETEGQQIGIINGLSVLEYPGHPKTFGEVSRISCVVYMGDNEITDIDRKVELAGNLHSKGMMIMQAFIASELATEHQLPFSASLVFEQSYSEIDGDSASLAELCVLLSSLAQCPINQNIAVTGSVDQKGHIQPVGGINEKIEAFFDLCYKRQLTGEQGVIIPYANMRHLSLRQDIVNAVKQNEFHIWYAHHVSDIPPILMNIEYHSTEGDSLMGMIKERINYVLQENKHAFSFLSRVLNWFGHN